MKKLKYYFIALLFFGLTACGNKTEEQQEKIVTPKTTVKVVSISNGSIDDDIILFGTTIYLKRNLITASIPSFITKVNVKLGDKVSKGDLLYVLQSKESRALGNDVHKIDPTLNNFGIIQVKASSAGIISTLERQQVGEYVLEGTQLCSIAESNDLAFQVNVPFEYTSVTKIGKSCTIKLPDNTSYKATFSRALTTMNVTAQTQTILAKTNQPLFLPENMMVKVSTSKGSTSTKQILPKSCVSTDEMMKEFWIMKVINDSTAVKVPVTIGNKNEDEIEILSPVFRTDDRIISEGNYGMADKALIKIVNN
ncbi:efflux RND transporter periplasmic adaptor subunit [Flavobacterium sp.]|uniref:efflux RND transporter periplasmic adaptor subunit n=1 Tax=Flavobacterium sp. TaxID=239 RepID=UPI004047ECD0